MILTFNKQEIILIYQHKNEIIYFAAYSIPTCK